MVEKFNAWAAASMESTLQTIKSASIIAIFAGIYYFAAYLRSHEIPFPTDFQFRL